jgi:hypothetical protein
MTPKGATVVLPVPGVAFDEVLPLIHEQRTTGEVRARTRVPLGR